MTKREAEARRWWRQALRDLESAEINARQDRHEVACFLCQQSAEKALKAFLYSQGESPVLGHSLLELSQRAAGYAAPFQDVREQAKTLDAHYIQARYPNGLAGDIVPADFFDKADSARALSDSRLIHDVVRSHLPPAVTTEH